MSAEPTIRTPRVLVQVLLIIVVVPALPLLIGRRRDWWEARVYALLNIAGFVMSRALAARRHPDLLAERARMTQHADAKWWDKILAPLTGLGGGLIPLMAGLESRFGRSRPFSRPAKLLALGALVAGYGLASWALVTNRFFSGMVRIQTERDHHVVSGGPYRWLRHPGYAGALLTFLATPVFLDSPWAFVPAFFISLVLVIRTALEDSTLQDELEGYRDYAARVPHRLLPGIW